MNKGSGRMSTMKKEGITTEDCRTNCKEPQTRPRRNILTAYVMRSRNLKDYDLMYIIQRNQVEKKTMGFRILASKTLQ